MAYGDASYGPSVYGESGDSSIAVNLGLITRTTTIRAVSASVGATVTLSKITRTSTVRPVDIISGQTVALGKVTRTTTPRALTPAVGVVKTLGKLTRATTIRGLDVASPDTRTIGKITRTSMVYSLAVDLDYGTVRRVRAGGRRRTGVASAEWSPAVVAVPVPFTHGQAVDLAQAFTVPVMVGTQPTYTITEKTATRHRDRIVVGGKDVTYFRNIPTPTPSYQLVEPLTYGPATLELPQVAAPFETPGVGDLAWLKPGKRVLLQRVDVDTGEVVATDYRGIVIAFDTSGRNLTVEVGGEASGRAALRDWPLPIFRQVQDAGRWAWHAIHSLGLRFSPRLGPETGIDLARFGGTGHLDYIRELCAKAQDRDGTQWTINRTDNGYKFERKDTATIDGTVYLDDARCVGELRRDIAEEPNVIYGTGVTPEGMRWQGGAFPGLLDTDPAPYPFRDGRTFGLGTQDADTDTGDGITVMIAKLRVSRYVGAADSPGGYDRDIVRAVKALQDDAGLSETGVMNVATWNALYDLETTGPSLRWSHIAPIAQKSYTRQFLRSGSGAIMGRNPNYDPSRLPVHRSIDFGAGVKERQGREWARRELDQSEDNWVGTITLHGGAVVAGDHTPGDPITTILRARDITTGMNLSLPLFAGGITVHVSAVSVSDTVTLTVDTRARDSLEVWEVIQRNRETRRDPARQWAQQHRASGEIKDSIDEWWEVGGLLGARKPLHGGRWNVFWVVAGQAGTVQKLALETNPNAEYAVAIFGNKISASTLDHTVGNPLTVAGRTKWDNESVRKRLDDKHLLLYAAGDKDSPCGYWPKQKILDTPFLHQKAANQKDIADIEANAASEGRALTDAENQQIAALNDEISDLDQKIAQAHAVTLTGAFKDEAGFSYYTQDLPVLWVAIYPDRNTSIPAGRIMWQQLEAGA